jgi:protein-S-isoprenylcysteine O-methyltransferase Ste14
VLQLRGEGRTFHAILDPVESAAWSRQPAPLSAGAVMTILRHLLSIALLPFVVVVVVPAWILTSAAAADVRWTDSPLALPVRLAGLLLFVAGSGLFAWCVALFARIGRGTLAPWDPTQRLVAVGPYRHTRNPMIAAVAVMLLGEALFFGSALLAGWSILFVVVNHIYFVAVEEPGLQRRFGASYDEYRQRVPRWLPRWSRH